MSEKPTESSLFERTVSRRELLEKAGKLGVGALVAGTLAGPAGRGHEAASTSKTVPTGGSITWGQDVDPGHIAPFGGILTANHQGNELMYDSLLEWDPKLNIRNALIESYDVVNSKRIVWTMQEGAQVLERPGGHCGRREVLVRPAGESAAAGQRRDAPRQFPAIDSTTAISKYKLQMDLKAPDARVYGYLAWGRYSSIVPNGMYQMVDPATNGIGTGPFKLDGQVRPEQPA